MDNNEADSEFEQEKVYLLHFAIRTGDIATALHLIKQKIDLEISDDNMEAYYEEFNCYTGKTPIYLAAHQGQLEVVKALIEAGVSLYTYGMLYDQFGALEPPMGAACTQGHIDIVRYFLELGYDPNYAFGDTNQTVIANASTCDIIELLIEFGADPNFVHSLTGETAFHFSAWRGKLKLMQCLANAGADIHLKTRRNTNALYYSVMARKIEAVRWLLGRHIDVSLICVDEQESALHSITRYSDEETGLTMLKEILPELGNSALRKFRNCGGKTALDYAYQRGSKRTVELLKSYCFLSSKIIEKIYP